jgi:hypothetical protein
LDVETKHSLYHGPGTIMGRMEAKGKTDRKTGQVLRPGKVTTEMMQGWLFWQDRNGTGGGEFSVRQESAL